MQGLDLIHHEHRELLRLTDVVIGLADDPQAGIEQVVAARHALGQVIIRHVLNKQAIITGTLQASADPAHRTLSWRFTEDLMKLRQSTSAHYGVWTVATIPADRKGFATAVRDQRHLLRVRIAWEEAEVFPIVAALLAPLPIRAAGGIR